MDLSDRIREYLETVLPSRGFLKPCFLSTEKIPTPIEPAALKTWLKIREEYGSFMITGLPFFLREPQDLSKPEDPHGLIAPFARRNYYREAVSILKEAIRDLSYLDPKEVRIFSNSSLPEKPLAALSGFGFYGRNSLIYTEQYGSNLVLAGIGFKIDIAGDSSPAGSLNLGLACKECSLCVEACPTGALDLEKGFNRERCLQHLSSEYLLLKTPLPDLWGKRIYGCTLCQESCPLNRHAEPGILVSSGEIGPSLSLKEILVAGKEEEGIKNLFRNTTLDRKWIDPRALLRNALIAYGNSGDPALLPLLRGYTSSGEEILAHHAQKAEEKLSKEMKNRSQSLTSDIA